MRARIPVTAAGTCAWSFGRFCGRSPKPAPPAARRSDRPRLAARLRAVRCPRCRTALTARPAAVCPWNGCRRSTMALCAEAQEGVAAKDLWCGHHVVVVDGSSVTAPDTPANQKAFPQQSVQKPGCGFPILRLVALLSLATGMLTAWATGPWSAARSGPVANALGLFASR